MNEHKFPYWFSQKLLLKILIGAVFFAWILLALHLGILSGRTSDHIQIFKAGTDGALGISPRIPSGISIFLGSWNGLSMNSCRYSSWITLEISKMKKKTRSPGMNWRRLGGNFWRNFKDPGGNSEVKESLQESLKNPWDISGFSGIWKKIFRRLPDKFLLFPGEIFEKILLVIFLDESLEKFLKTSLEESLKKSLPESV